MRLIGTPLMTDEELARFDERQRKRRREDDECRAEQIRLLRRWLDLIEMDDSTEGE